MTVFDPSNYSQNLLTAARTLEQITNQVRSLQNEARMLTNQAKNLARIDFPELQELTTKLAAIDRLMGQAQGKIGRESCRERVWQYGEISLVGVPLKTKMKQHKSKTQ